MSTLLILKLVAAGLALLGTLGGILEAHSKGLIGRADRCDKGHELKKVGKNIYYCPICSSRPFKGEQPGYDSDYQI